MVAISTRRNAIHDHAIFCALVNKVKLKKEAGKYGLTINQNKTKYMRLSRTQTHRKDTETEEMKFEEASRVKYLGTIVTKDNLIEEEIKKESQPVIEPSL